MRWIIGARTGVFALLGLATFAVFSDRPYDPTPTLLFRTTAVALASNAAYLVWLRLRRALVTLGAVQILGDLALWCVVVYLTGGAESAFSVLFHLSVIVAAFAFGWRGAAMAAGVAAVLFGCTAVALNSGLLAPPEDLTVVSSMAPRQLAYYLGVNVSSLAIVATLAGYLAHRERRAGGQLEEARKTSADLAALNEDIVRSLPTGLAACDTQGAVVWINAAGLAMMGRDESSVVGHPLDDVAGARILASAPADGVASETPLRRADGAELFVSYRLTPLLDGSGTRRGSLLAFQDLTEIRAMQDRVNRAERLAALGRLAAAMAHELRNPLGSISGSLEMLSESSGLTEQDRRLSSIVLREVERLSSLVTQMLDVARPREPERAWIDVSSLANEVASVVGRSAEAAEVTLELESPARLVANVDAHQIRQLLWNLLKNGLEASPAGGKVRLRLAAEERDLVVEVEDEGPGVPPADRDKVFELFYSTKQGGMGMGLAICRQVVQLHGGTIGCAPREGEGGSLFTVRIPGSVQPQEPAS